VKNNRKLVNFGIYVERYTKGKKWFDLLDKVCPNIDLVQTKAFLHDLQFCDGTNEVVKVFSKMVYSIRFKPDELLLSGIIDIKYIEVHHKELEKEYRNKRIWDKLDEKFLIQDLPPSLKNFIEEYIFNQDTEIPKEVNLKEKKLFRATRNLLDRILPLWDAFNYKPGSFINESTWAHDIIDPISRFIKTDIFGIYTNVNGKYNWEILYGEVSNGPFTNTPQSKVHKIEDRVKLGKFAKDSLDNAFKHHARSYYSDFQKLNIFLLQSSELFIFDREYAPLFRLRRLALVELPFQKNSSSTELVINLVKVLLVYRKLLLDNLTIIKSIELKSIIEDGEEQSNGGKSEFGYLIPTSNTSRSSINIKK
ncbi:30583_t:CDS:2, partial [Gigaspora margarita]